MTKRALFVGILVLFLLYPSYGERFADEKVIKKVEEHSVAITVIYWMDDDTFKRKMREETLAPKIPFQPPNYPSRFIAYIGAGTVIRPGNLVMTVDHLFIHGIGTEGRLIIVWFKNEKQIQAYIVKQSKHKDFYDDYALLRLPQKTDLKGIKIAKKQSEVGDKVIFVGSTGAFGFRMRFGYLEDWKYHFQKDEGGGKLQLAWWWEFILMCVHPGGPGDSGGGIFNDKGELTGMMYCGTEIYAEEYIFSNPLDMMKEFLKDTPGERALEYESDIE